MFVGQSKTDYSSRYQVGAALGSAFSKGFRSNTIQTKTLYCVVDLVKLIYKVPLRATNSPADTEILIACTSLAVGRKGSFANVSKLRLDSRHRVIVCRPYAAFLEAVEKHAGGPLECTASLSSGDNRTKCLVDFLPICHLTKQYTLVHSPG